MGNLFLSFMNNTNIENIRQMLTLIAGVLVFVEFWIVLKWIKTKLKIKKVDLNSFENINIKQKKRLSKTLKIWFWIILLTILLLILLIVVI